MRLRGIQAAFFARGFLLSMQLTSGAHIGPADLRLYLEQGVAERLRALCTPLLAAAMTLALVTEMTPAQLCELDLADVDGDGATVQVDGDRFAIPAYARSLVRAQLLDCAGQRASPTDPLFVTPRDQQRSSPSATVGYPYQWPPATGANVR